MSKIDLGHSIPHLQHLPTWRTMTPMVIPVQIRPKRKTITVKGRKETFETGMYEAYGYLEGRWVRIPGTSKRPKDLYGNIHKWAVDRSFWFDEGRMEVKGTVLK